MHGLKRRKKRDRRPKNFRKSAGIQPKTQGPKNRVGNRENDGFVPSSFRLFPDHAGTITNHKHVIIWEVANIPLPLPFPIGFRA